MSYKGTIGMMCNNSFTVCLFDRLLVAIDPRVKFMWQCSRTRILLPHAEIENANVHRGILHGTVLVFCVWESLQLQKYLLLPNACIVIYFKRVSGFDIASYFPVNMMRALLPRTSSKNQVCWLS